jgi:dimethylhistidine N-methyltransferase
MDAPTDPAVPIRFSDLRSGMGEGRQHEELLAGLLDDPPRIAPKYFYDELGSRLFEAICCLPEYYLTRTEAEIFASHEGEIADAIGPGRLMIDLGAGDGKKAAGLFSALRPAGYLALDISADFLRAALAKLGLRHPRLPIAGAAIDFTRGLELPRDLFEPQAAPRLWFYPGSSIGNFHPGEARTFLGRIARQCAEAPGGGALLIGVDLVKGAAVLDAAYDDALGVTAAFNQNMLLHVNRLLGADFDVRDWRHMAFFNAEASRVEMHLEASRDVAVSLSGRARRFAAGARIHTECSYKWTPEKFGHLLNAAGFTRLRTWTDACGWFALVLAEV